MEPATGVAQRSGIAKVRDSRAAIRGKQDVC